jgi:hypothetical protein
MFLVGATMGEMVGIAFAHAFPGAHIQPGAFALVGMGATFGVGARALLTGVVFAAEVTGGYGMLVPLLLATGVAELVAELGLDDRVMTDKLRRRGYRVDFDAQTDPLRMRVAALVMRPVDLVTDNADLPRVDRWAYLSEALAALLEADQAAVAVTDRGQVVGRVTRSEIESELRRRIADEHVQPPTLGPFAPRAAHRAAEAAAEGADRPEPEPIGDKPPEPEVSEQHEERDSEEPTVLRSPGGLTVSQERVDLGDQPAGGDKRRGAGASTTEPSSRPPRVEPEVDGASCPDP